MHVRLQVGSAVNAVAFDATGQYLSVGSDIVQVYNFAKKASMAEAVALKDHQEAVMGVCFSQHAKSLTTVCLGASVLLCLMRFSFISALKEMLVRSMDRTLKIYR